MPTCDFWLLAGVALVCVGIGQCTRMDNERFVRTPETAAAELLDACADRIRMGFDVPAICKPDAALAKADKK